MSVQPIRKKEVSVVNEGGRKCFHRNSAEFFFLYHLSNGSEEISQRASADILQFPVVGGVQAGEEGGRAGASGGWSPQRLDSEKIFL